MDATMIDDRAPEDEGPDWLQIAKDAFTSSTTYLDANLRPQFERNISLFQSKHPSGSKYNSDAFRKRSRLFRPKTKSVVRKNEAAAAAAFFANVDVVSVNPQHDSDQLQAASAELMNEVINYRLTQTIPWYITLLGALQEAQMYADRDDPISRQQFERRGAQAQEDGDKVRALMDKESGKMEYVWNVLKLTGDMRAKTQLRMFYGKLLELGMATGGNLGVWRENARYMVEYDKRVTAAGGMRTVKAMGLEG
jgi:hypothetical protein